MTAGDRVHRGTRRMLELRDARVAGGERQIGWKVGFGSPAALAAFRLDRPLVGFLLDSGRLADGAGVPLAGWRNPMLEAEIAVHVGAGGSIAGLGAAIELADVHPAPEDVETILAGDVFHRHVVLGPVVAGRASSDGVTARVLVDGEEVAATDDPSALVGELREVVGATAATLADHGERLREGDVVITGSVFPPLPVRPGQRVDVELDPLGRLGLTFCARGGVALI